jgi:hypothetical protein
MRRTLIALAFSALCPAGGALAHHGSAEYDMTTVVRYEGVIAEFRWMNPHSLTVLQTQSPSGKPIRLEKELPAPDKAGNR